MTQTTSSTPTPNRIPDPNGDHDRANAALEVVLRRERDEPVLAREPVRDGDLVEARSAVWMDGYLRHGDLAVGLDDLEWRTTTVQRREAGAGPRLSGFRLSGFCLSGFCLRAHCRRTGRSEALAFDVRALEHVATRASSALVRAGALAEGDAYVYELEVPARPVPAAPAAVAGLTIETVSAPFETVTAPLGALLDAARPVGEIADTAFPVLFTASAHRSADRHARRGAGAVPPVETGCMLLGRIGSCPERGELFALVEHAIEVRAEASAFAMVYTAETWRLVQSAMDGYVAQGAARRMLGQAHGHNFCLTGEPCAACAHAAECSRTTVFVSGEDDRFMRSVFARQPWALCLIAGTNMRNEPVARLYTWRRGVLARGFHVIDDDDARRLAPSGA